MTNTRQLVGAFGERLAERTLVADGMVVIARNWRCAAGEVDLILRDGDDVVFCEVKTRRGDAYGTPAEAIDHRKVRRLRHLAATWLTTSGVRPREVRFDVVSVLCPAKGTPTVEHVRGAF